MKYLLVLLLGLILGALAYRQISINPTRPPAPGEPANAAPPVSGPGSATTPAAPAATTTPPLPVAVPPPASWSGSSNLLIPVQGKTAADLVDTFTDARSEDRLHDAIDIMADAGTPVLAVADGKVEKLFNSERGGLTVYQFEPSGKIAYYYAHLERYADGLAEQQPLRRGQIIGYVGSTGNASPDGPHLHFAVFLLGPERKWSEGTAINPYPLLVGKR